MPFLKSTEILTYNTEIVQVALNKMGIQTGVENYMKNITYSEFIELVKFVGDHKSEFDGVDEEDFVPWFYDSDSNLFITQCFQRGTNYISMNDGSGSIDFVNDGAKAMIQEYKELYSKGYMTTKGITGEHSSNYFKNLQERIKYIINQILENENILIEDNVVLRGDLAMIVVGRDTILGENVIVHPSLNSNVQPFEYKNLSIGSYCFIGKNSIISSFKIGNYVYIF